MVGNERRESVRYVGIGADHLIVEEPDVGSPDVPAVVLELFPDGHLLADRLARVIPDPVADHAEDR